MKKLLLATSILTISSAAIAANTSTELDSAETDTITVTAKYVIPITVTLDTATIDFGDVWTDSVISAETVVATVVGEAAETFSYSVTATNPIIILGGNIVGSTQGFVTSTTTQALTFTVDLDTANAATATSVSETVTISVVYDAIANTTRT
ncbi:MAG: hypothetical protein ACI965_000019 [Paraglaciecola sp.]|jgi:hypothetical protein